MAEVQKKVTRRQPAAPPAPLELPETFAESYSDADRLDVLFVIDYLNRTSQTQADLCRRSSVNAGTASQVLRGYYPSSPSQFLANMRSTIDVLEERNAIRSVPFVETGMIKLARTVCNRARTYRSFGLLVGNVGTGKTRSLREIAAETPNTYLIESNPEMKPGALMSALVTATGATLERSGSSVDDKFDAVCKKLSGTTSLIIIDDPERIQPRCLHYLRRLRDIAQIGVVLSGTPELLSLISPNSRGHFDQIRSRVCCWPATVQAISRDDADAVSRAAFAGDLAPDVLDELWSISAGSMRVLAEFLLPQVRDYQTRSRLPLSAALIRQVAAESLRLSKEAA